MLIFFGVRSAALSNTYHLKNTTCTYCSTENSFRTRTYLRYFHIFWIPFFPLGKTTVAECSHCRKTYRENEFTPEMHQAIARERATRPEKRPLWSGCGCLLLILLAVGFALSSVLIGIFAPKDPDKEQNSIYKTQLQADLDKMVRNPDADADSTAAMLKTCIDFSLIDEMKTENYQYYTRTSGKKLLVLMKTTDMKKVKGSSRGELMEALKACLSEAGSYDSLDWYIGVRGNWNMLLTSSPEGSDLDGKFADEKLLYGFYKDDAVTTK